MIKDDEESTGSHIQLTNILSKVSGYKITGFPVHKRHTYREINVGSNSIQIVSGETVL